MKELRYDLTTVLDLLVEGVLDEKPVWGESMTANLYKQTMRYALVCSDGFTMSVQMSAGHYCEPRRSGLESADYLSAELGYPSEPEELILQYAEEPEDPTETVYGRVPMQVLEQVFQKHGGLHPREVIRLKKIQKQLEAR